MSGQAQRASCRVIMWDELDGTPTLAEKDGDTEFNITRGDDKAMVADVRRIVYDDTADYDDPDDDNRGWELVAVVHTPRTTLMEFASDRGHVATTQLIWI